MLLGGVARHQVQKDPDAQLMGFPEQGKKVLVGAVAGGHQLVVPHVVASVLEGGVEAGVQPQGVAPKVLHVGELLPDAVDVADLAEALTLRSA